MLEIISTMFLNKIVVRVDSCPSTNFLHILTAAILKDRATLEIYLGHFETALETR